MNPKDCDVIVIGAGLAGVTAARELQALGHQVIVVEADGRIGGRIETSHELGFPVELGACWLHGHPHNQLSPLFGETLVPTDFSSTANYSESGERLSPQEVQSQLEESWRWLGRAQRCAIAKNWNLSLLDALSRSALEEFAEGDAAIGKQLTMELFLEDLSQISAQHPLHAQPAPGQDSWLKSGLSGWLEKLAAPLDLRLQWPVSEIAHGPEQVEVRSARGSLRAKAAVVTLPLGVLQSQTVKFQPPLDATKQRALKGLKMALQNKIVLVFEEQFWPSGQDMVQIGTMSYLDLSHHLGRAILITILREKNAQAWERRSDRQTLKYVCEPLRKAFGNAYREPREVLYTRWGADPLRRGALSYAPWPESAERFDDLACPQGRLFFAGEATHRHYFATLQGAYLSARRAAQEAHAAIKI